MKKITHAFSVLVVAGLLIASCKKTTTPTPTPMPAPVTPPEQQSSSDVSYVLFTITDIEMIGSFISENSLAPTFYVAAPGSAGSVTPAQDTAASFVSFSFNQATCVDGRLRNGTVVVDRSYGTAAAHYYRDFGYTEHLFLSEYEVDGWKISTVNDNNTLAGQPCVVANKLNAGNWNPANTNLSWSVKGNFKLKKGTDSVFCKVDLVKTLTNTSDVTVFAADKTHPINWSRGIVSYSGSMSGILPGNLIFNMNIDASKAVVRDFTCAPDNNQYHPFINGVADLTPGQLGLRQICYGGATAADIGRCDNSGALLYQGTYFAINFREQ